MKDEKQSETPAPFTASIAPESTLEVLRAELATSRESNRLLREKWQVAQDDEMQECKLTEVVKRITARMAEQLQLNAFLETLLLEAGPLLNAVAGRVVLVDNGQDGGKVFTLLAHTSDGHVMDEAWMNERGMPRVIRFADFPEFAQSAMELEGPRFFSLESGPPWPWPGAEWSRQAGHRSGVVAPLRCAEHNIGFLSFRFRHDKALAEREMAFIGGLASQASLAVQMSRLAEEQQSAAQVAAVLDERNRIAREIHDTLAQTLTGVILQAEAASRALPDMGAVGAHLERISTLAREGLQEARQSVRALRPSLLDGSTLARALAALCARQSGKGEMGTRFEFTLKGIPRPLPPEVEDALLRVTQESLVNVERHARARTAWVELRFDPPDVDSMQCICMRVQDDGRGFDVHTLGTHNSGFGMVGMRERMEMLGGTLDISSRHGRGTEVRAGIALPA